MQHKLNRNLSLNGINNVAVLPFALSDEESVQSFSIPPDIWNQGTFSLSQKSTHGGSQQVQIKIGDNLSEINTLKKINLIKIDVEGFEFSVIQGLKNAIDKHRPKIIFEYDKHYWESSNNSISACYDFFAQRGYSLYQILDANAEIIGSLNAIQSGNILCIPNNKID